MSPLYASVEPNKEKTVRLNLPWAIVTFYRLYLVRYCGLSVELCAVIMKHKHSSNAGITKATKFIGKTYTVQDIKSSAVRSSVSSSSFEVGTGPSDENQITCL